MSKRIEILQQMFERGYPYQNWVEALKPEEMDTVVRFIRAHNHLDKNDFQHVANRFLISPPISDIQKKYEENLDSKKRVTSRTKIEQILTNVNTALT